MIVIAVYIVSCFSYSPYDGGTSSKQIEVEMCTQQGGNS